VLRWILKRNGLKDCILLETLEPCDLLKIRVFSSSIYFFIRDLKNQDTSDYSDLIVVLVAHRKA
jgi:hypothetical protein